jgi:hypothetical protein
MKWKLHPCEFLHWLGFYIYIWIKFCIWGCSSNGRALALHARGTGFDTPHLHDYILYIFSFLLWPLRTAAKSGRCKNWVKLKFEALVKSDPTAGLVFASHPQSLSAYLCMELSFSPSSSLRIQAVFPHCKTPFYHTKIPTKPTSKSHRSLLECHPILPSIALCGHRSCSEPASNRRYKRNYSIWVWFISLTNHIEFVHFFSFFLFLLLLIYVS